MRTVLALMVALFSMPVSAQDEWRHLKPLQLLEMLQRHPGKFFVATHSPQRGFVQPEDLDGLMSRLDSPEPCAAVLRFESAHLPTARSTVGREAALLVVAFQQGYYPAVPASDLHAVDPDRLRTWWEEWRRLPPAREWASGRGHLEPDVVYIGDFRIQDGWTPVIPVPAPMHHAVRVDFQNLDDFGHLRFGVWKEARLTFRVLRADVNPIDPPRRWNTTYVAEILRAE